MVLVFTVQSVAFQRRLGSSYKIIIGVTKLQSVLIVARFYLSGTSTDMSSLVKGRFMDQAQCSSVDLIDNILIVHSTFYARKIKLARRVAFTRESWIVGGAATEARTTAEVFDVSTRRNCTLPQLQDERYGHTLVIFNAIQFK